MKSLPTLFLVVLFALVSARAADQSMPQAQDASALAAIEITASPLGRSALLFSVNNNGVENMQLYWDMLPWNSRGSTILTLIPLKAGSPPSDQNHPISDPGPTTIQVLVKQSIKGQLELASCFDDFALKTKGIDFVVFWSLNLLDPATKHIRRYNGVVEFPKKLQP